MNVLVVGCDHCPPPPFSSLDFVGRSCNLSTEYIEWLVTKGEDEGEEKQMVDAIDCCGNLLEGGMYIG